MAKRQLLGFAYVSLVVMLWGTIGSLIDYPLLKNNIYIAGSIGQYITFIGSGFILTVPAIILFRKIPEKYFN